MTWLDRYFASHSGGSLGFSSKLALPLSIIGVAVCKHPTARKNAWKSLGWHAGLFGLAIILVLLWMKI
jgi:hypothetical protein